MQDQILHPDQAESDHNLRLPFFHFRQLTENGIVKSVKTSCNKIYFDTNTTSHHHFFCKNSSTLIDIESKNIKISKLPKIPNGKKLDSVEIVVNLTE